MLATCLDVPPPRTELVFYPAPLVEIYMCDAGQDQALRMTRPPLLERITLVFVTEAESVVTA